MDIHNFQKRLERTFVTRRISQAAMLDESYKIPKGWEPESIVSSR